MKRSRFTESQIVEILKEADAGLLANEVWRKHGISSATYYKWKAKYGGLEISELVRVKSLNPRAAGSSACTRNWRWKMSDQGAAKKTVAPPARRGTVDRLVSEGGLSIQRACRAVNLSRAAYYRTAKDFTPGDEPVVEALNGVVARHAGWGFWKCYERLRLDGHQWNHKRTWRIYRAMRLNLPRRARKRLVRPPQPLDAPLLPNEIWALDFMGDSLYQGRLFAP